MSTEQVFLSMVLLHMMADYTLQGWLADGKQKAWWEKLVPDMENTMYRYDYVVALVCHSLYWSLLVCLPFWDCPYVSIAVIANTAIHAVVDDAKANRHKISLLTDQMIHLGQIVLTFAVLCFGR